MLLEDGRFYYSPGDLRTFAICQLGALRRADAVLGRCEEVIDTDLLGQRMGAMGTAHQQRVLEQYVAKYGVHEAGSPGGVAVLSGQSDPFGQAAAAGLRILDQRPDVVAQLPISAGGLYGAADLLVRVADRWQLVEVRLGLRLKDVYLLQIGAIALGLLSRGVQLEADAVLITGSQARIDVPLMTAMDRAREEITQIEAALAARLSADGPASWDDDQIRACGWCQVCRHEMTLARDVRLTAGVRMPDRELLRAAGIRTIDDLAVAEGPVPELEPERLETIRAQARLQVRQMPPGTELDESLQRAPVYEVFDDQPLRDLPDPDAGDIFLDLESEPMWQQDADDVRGLHYLFGMRLVDDVHPYVTFWAHDRMAERQALLDLLEFIEQRYIEHPGLHIYHYGNYETVVLRELTRRHATAGERLEALLEAGLFIDLLPVVKGSLRTSQPGYGLKKIEPLYMGEESRTGDVTDGAASVLGYQRYTELRASGHFGEAGAVLDALAGYNEYDCYSTLKLRDWLLSLR